VFHRIDWQTARRFALTFGVSAAGGLVAQLLGLPAGWIAGGVLAVAVASLAGLNTDVPRALHPPVFLVIGAYAGGGVSHETLRQMQTWPASFAILGVSVVGVIASSYWWLHGRTGWDRTDAVLASLPGALSLVMATAEDLKADLKKVAIAQSLRLLILVELIPLIALLIGHPTGAPAAASAETASLRDILIMLVVGAAAGFVVQRLKVPGGWMLGALLASAALLLGGVVEGRLPFDVVLLFVIMLAAITGSRLRPGDMAILPRIVRPALIAFALALLISAVSAGSVTLLLGVNIIQTLLAFAPGALDALVIIAFQMNIDPAYVAAHHVARFLGLALAVPILARWLARG
jgi:membrane AbrB-like protein